MLSIGKMSFGLVLPQRAMKMALGGGMISMVLWASPPNAAS
jgi:hypothetical protein